MQSLVYSQLVCSWALRTGRAASVPACPSAWRPPGPNPSYRDLLSPLHYKEGTGVGSDVVKVQGEDPATPGPLI